MYNTLEDVITALKKAKKRDPSGREILDVVEGILEEYPYTSTEAQRKFTDGVANAINSRDLSISKVAESIGISGMLLWQIKNGRSVSPELAAKISRVLSIDSPYESA